MTVIKVILAVVLTSHITSSQRNSDEGINYENLRKFMSQTPAELEATLHLLENPFVAAALVNGDRAFRNQNARPTSTTPPTPPPQEETNNLLNFLLSQRGRPGPGSNSGNGYKITRPNDPLVPPSVDTRGILSDPLLGSFFMDNGEDQPPLEMAKNRDPSVPIIRTTEAPPTQFASQDSHRAPQYSPYPNYRQYDKNNW